VAIDGTKLQGNASKHKAMSYGRMGEKIRGAELACIIHERMAKAFCGGTRLPKMLMAP
jgi:hypothetical protein